MVNPRDMMLSTRLRATGARRMPSLTPSAALSRL